MTTLKVQKREMDKKAKQLRKEGFVTGNLFGKDIVYILTEAQYQALFLPLYLAAIYLLLQ